MVNVLPARPRAQGGERGINVAQTARLSISNINVRMSGMAGLGGQGPMCERDVHNGEQRCPCCSSTLMSERWAQGRLISPMLTFPSRTNTPR